MTTMTKTPPVHQIAACHSLPTEIYTTAKKQQGERNSQVFSGCEPMMIVQNDNFLFLQSCFRYLCHGQLFCH